MNNQIEILKMGEYLAKDSPELVKKLFEIKDQVEEMEILDKNRGRLKKDYNKIAKFFNSIRFYIELREKLNLSKFLGYEFREKLTSLEKITNYESCLRPTSWKKKRDSILEQLRNGKSISDGDILESLKKEGIEYHPPDIYEEF